MQQSDGGSPSEDPREAVVGPLDLEAHVDEALAVQAVAFGLTDDEVSACVDAGAHAVRLGAEVLRTSTAGVAAAAALLSRTSRWA